MRTDATPLPRRKKSCLEIGYSEPGEPVIYLNFNYLVNAFIWLAGGDALTGGDANVGLHDHKLFRKADKHVLENVTRAERFIRDAVRKCIVEELAFPNFHTLILGDGSYRSRGGIIMSPLFADESITTAHMKL